MSFIVASPGQERKSRDPEGLEVQEWRRRESNPRRGPVADDAEGDPDLLGEWLSEFVTEPRHKLDSEGEL